jgi:hypothetical protein
MQNKTRLELADYEAENLAKLQKLLSRKWEFIYMQAEAQIKVDKKRDKLERKILDSQERAFWDVYRPAPGCVNTTEIDIRKTMRTRRTDHPNIGFFRTKINNQIKNLSINTNVSGLPSVKQILNQASSIPIVQPNIIVCNNKYNENEDSITLENLRKEKDFLKRRLERRYVKTSKVQER